MDSSTLDRDNFELISILLVSQGSSGPHLLFKYPFSYSNEPFYKIQSSKRTAYSIVPNDNWIIEKEQKLVVNGLLCGLDNDVLAVLCTSNKEKLELKIDNIFFLCSQNILCINKVTYNVVFAVKSPLPRPVKSVYQNLSLAICKALLKEEANSQYLTQQSRILTDFIDEHQNLNESPDIGFADALEKSNLAKEIKSIYESIKKDGIIDILINNWARLSFCLPHLAYKITEKCEQTHFVEVIFDAFKYLRPYLGILLLIPKEKLLESLPFNCNYYTLQLIEIYNPRFSLTRYASELDVPINEIYSIVDHLIYWSKIKIIYPISETNVYVIHPDAEIHLGKKVVEEFSQAFDNIPFHLVISLFSYAKPLVDHLDPSQPKEKHALFVDMIIWLLQRNILMQLHTFIYLLPKKVEHQRLLNEQFSKISALSFDEENEYSMTGSKADGGSEHSNETENTEQKDVSAIYDEYRDLFNEYKVSEKDQQYIFKAFEQKSENDIKLFVQLFPYYNGLFNFEAIIYNEKINRSELITFLDKFKDLLIVSMYEDPNPLVRINVKLN